MLRKGILLIAIAIGAHWPTPARGGEDIDAAIDAFLVQEAARIEQARTVLETRFDGVEMTPGYRAFLEKYIQTVTPLHIAAQDGNLAEVRELIQKGSDINAVAHGYSDGGWTPLFMAAMFNRLDVMRCLLENGANPDMADTLYETAIRKRIAAMRLLLEFKANPNQPTMGKSTALSGAYATLWSSPRHHSLEALQLLLDAGADPNMGGPGGRNVLELASMDGNEDAKRLLIKYGATLPNIRKPVDAKLPALHRAARDGDLATVVKLVQDGADINQADDEKGGWTPALYAAKHDRREVLAWLAEHGADLNVPGKPPFYNILYTAALGDNIEVMRICLKHGVPVDSRLALGRSPFTAVVIGVLSSRDWNTAAFLLENGADINWRGDHGMTPLHLMAAAELWDFDKVGMENLISAGADRGALDEQGLSPLHYAAARDNRRALAVMLQKR